MICIKCQNQIPDARLKALPNAKTCVQCSDTERIGCHTIISGKNTYSEIQLVDRVTSANLYRMQSRKGFGVSTGVKFKFDSRTN
jgi:translation initiation factor IF-1